MDEMSMVRRLLAEPPPNPRVVAEGRERLFDSALRGSRIRTTPTIRRAAFRTALGLGLTGTLATVALVVATLIPGAGTSPRTRDPAATDGTARNVLLAAAVRAEAAPTSGTYWHVRSMSRTTWGRGQKLGRGDNRYAVEHLSVHENWTKRNGQAWWGSREWVRPKSPEDEAAWRRDGSPSKWCRGKTDTEPPRPNCLHTAPGTASLAHVGDDTFVVAEGRGLTFVQLRRLPDDPDTLRAWVVDAVKDDLHRSVSADILDYNVAEVLANLLVDVPAPPGVRAAAYRALADMPNVTSTGPTRDELGRAGVGILIDTGAMAGAVFPGGRRFKAGELTRKLIIDPATSYVLASQTIIGERSDPFSDTLILEVGWTDEKPHKPALP
jgi:hypothetical protein